MPSPATRWVRTRAARWRWNRWNAWPMPSIERIARAPFDWSRGQSTYSAAALNCRERKLPHSIAHGWNQLQLRAARLALGSQHALECGGRKRIRIKVSLPLGATGLQQELMLRFGLDAFGDGDQAEAGGHGQHRAGDRGVVDAVRQAGDERAVDLEVRHRRQFKVRHRRVTRAEIVDRDGDAERLQGTHRA